MEIGALHRGGDRCEFKVWAPRAADLSVRIVSPRERIIPLEREANGYWHVLAEDVPHGTRYLYRIDNRTERPDPASRWQPDDVHASSAVVDHSVFGWTDGGWTGIPLDSMVMYELHVGTFTPEGTFDAVIPRLDALQYIGITTISLMPVAQFPGSRNWGYDGAYPCAVQSSYGGPDSLKRLVNACHARGLAILLDVVYNHLGPEGNYLGEFGPYFTDRYRTPWGMAVNYDGAWSNGVRNYVIENAIAWLRDYHLDGLRLDAVHGIFDFSARHILTELSERVDEFSRVRGRVCHLIAESDLNDPVVIRPRDEHGRGCHAQWNDDFHHALHTLLTGERDGYYEDFGAISDLAASLRDGYVYAGRYSRYRKRRHGESSCGMPAERFVVFSQNHDQVGNRMRGERLTSQIPFEALKLAAGAVILSPYIPLLFMGEEYGEPSPFQYFVSHHDPELIEAVREGRRKEFKAFQSSGEPPDPADVETFRRSILDWGLRNSGTHAMLLRWYAALIEFRNRLSTPIRLDDELFEVEANEERRTIVMRRGKPDNIAVIMHFGSNESSVAIGGPPGRWCKVLDAADMLYEGSGGMTPCTVESSETFTAGPYAFAVYQREQ